MPRRTGFRLCEKLSKEYLTGAGDLFYSYKTMEREKEDYLLSFACSPLRHETEPELLCSVTKIGPLRRDMRYSASELSSLPHQSARLCPKVLSC